MPEILSRIGSDNAAGLNKDPVKINRIGCDLSFSEFLRTRLEQEIGVRFSAHALERLNERGIILEFSYILKISSEGT